MTMPVPPRDDTAAPASTPRLLALDGLRGVFALGVMAFHYLMWTAPPEAQPARALVLAVGLYCVDGFFVISGLSLTVASGGTDWTRPRQWLAFAVRRFARLWPLYAAATLLAALVLVRNGVPASSGLVRLVLVNLTLLFGWIDPSRAIPVGGWSLAIEVVLYGLFPVVMLAARDRGWVVPVVLLASVIAMTAGAALIDPARSLAEQWPLYVRWWQHAAFFVAGMILGRMVPRLAALPCPAGVALLAAGLGLATASAMVWGSADSVSLVTPAPRLAFLVALTLMAAAAARPGLGAALPDRVAALLGQASYPVYLLHPLVFEAVRGITDPGPALAAAAIPVVIMASLAVHRGLELPLIRAGARLARQITARERPVAVAPLPTRKA